MTAPNLKAYSSDGLTLLSSIILAITSKGSPSAATAFRLVNDDSGGAVDPARAPALRLLQYDADNDQYLDHGFRAIDERWCEVRFTGGGDSVAGQPATAWTPLGRGRWLVASELLSGEYHECEIRYNPPSTAPEEAIEVSIDAEDRARRLVVDYGHTESSPDGILGGVGDSTHTELVLGDPITASSPEAATVEVPDLFGIVAGVPVARLATTEAISDQDLNADPLVSGEAYRLRASLGASGLTLTKGVKATAGSELTPAVPSGELDLGWIRRDFDALISAADIVSDPLVGRHHPTATALTLHVGPGRDRIDNGLLRDDTRSNVTLPASEATVHVWKQSDGSFTSTLTSTPPSDRAMLLYVVTTDPTTIDVDGRVDHRSLVAPGTRVDLHFPGAPAGGETRRWINLTGRTAWLRVPRSIAFAADTPGAGNAAGEVAVDLTLGGVDAFTSKATDDRRPRLTLDEAVDHDDARRAAAAVPILPEVLEIPPLGEIVATLDLITAFDVAAPSGLRLSLILD